eukprot:m.137265 g.137265  ORF g.137265 m.137265 type:complete len:50 (+) comp17583_c0_seq3:3181-3330(+)
MHWMLSGFWTESQSNVVCFGQEHLESQTASTNEPLTVPLVLGGNASAVP